MVFSLFYPPRRLGKSPCPKLIGIHNALPDLQDILICLVPVRQVQTEPGVADGNDIRYERQ